ncbi:T9SS type A sorting domain-containing protein [Flavobacterium pectinovorum]|uniref:T9SS C-terminal target domain-containing protein n=1 Tax=Flavobacterium pectinovorum TaxID=29533 RepID=A0A502F1B5_9FLAO|nr:T9SS type A sorting domain-containing protein [Flavobacterium pectinovorum]TPG43823.1 T9SS C-terminal target domain-containing protein [Flavobacterium pectinovorum]
MKKLYSLLLLIVFGILSSNAQTIDETFVQPTPYKAAKIAVIKELSDGKILLGGHIQFFKEKKVSNLIRLNADYSLDETFVFNGDLNSEIKDVKFQSNGNIIVLTTKGNSGYADYFKLYQLDPNGGIIKEVSTIFNATSIAIQADDKILVTGGAIGYYNFTSCYVNRFNSDFSLDDTFKNDLAFNGATNNVVVSGTAIYVGGAFTAIDDIAKNSLVKLTSDGVIDTTFDVGQGSNGSGFSMTLQDDGKLLIGGNFFNTKDNVTSTSLIRLNSDGLFDESFSTSYSSFGSSVIGLKDSYIYIATQIPVNDGISSGTFLVRLKPNGVLDESFNKIKLNELGGNYFVSGFANEKIFYNNSEYTGNKYGLSICDLNGNILDSSELKPSRYGSFESGGYFDGKLVVKGDFVKLNDVETFGIGLLDENGSVNQSFIFPNYLGDITQCQIIDDQTIFISTKEKLLKLNNDGEILKDFDFKSNFDLYIQQFKVLNNGKFLITYQSGLYMFNEDGTQEIVYSLNSDPNFWISVIKFDMQGDKIICAAQFESFGAGYRPKSKLIRFNLDGSIDKEFKADSYTDASVTNLNVLKSGEIVIAGYFLDYSGTSTPNQLVKLSKDGEIDVKFNENLKIPKVGISGGEYYDYRKIEEVDSVIYITQVPSKVTAINLDGTIKTDFEMPAVIDNITDIVGVKDAEDSSPVSHKAKSVSTSDNYMFAIGTNNNSNSSSSSTIVKLNLGKSSGSLSVRPTPEKLASNVQVFPVPVQEKVSLSFTNSIVPNKIAVYSVNGKELYSAKVQSTDNLEVDMSGFASGIYFIKLSSDSGTITKKIVKK